MNSDSYPATTDQDSLRGAGEPQPGRDAAGPETVEELLAAREALEQSRRQWEVEIRKKQEEFKAMASELARHQGDRFDDSPRAAASDEPPEPAGFQPIDDRAPLDAASVLAKVYGGNPLDADANRHSAAPRSASAGGISPPGFRPSATPAPVAASPANPPIPELPTAEDEESLQQYMAEMMKRVRGESGPLQPAAPQRPAPKQIPKPRPQPIEAIQPASHAPAGWLSELPQRKLPPEMTSDLSAMRALANRSAQTALDSHTRSRWLQAGWGKAAVALCGLLAGLLLSYWSGHLGSYSILAAGLSYMVFLFWGLQAMIILSFAYRTDFSTEAEPPSILAPTTEDPSVLPPHV